MAQIVGFSADGSMYCQDCAERKYGPDSPTRRDREGNLVHPVFSDEEWDSPQHCSVCHRFLAVRMTRDGLAYIREQGPKVPQEWRDAYRS